MKRIDINKLSKKLSTQLIEVNIMNFDFKFYKLELKLSTHCYFALKESYIPKRWYYKSIQEWVNSRKKEFIHNVKRGNEKYFDKFYVE